MFSPRAELVVITGPMFSGKSEITLRELRRAQVAKRRVLLLRPALDDRTEPETVRARSGVSFPARVAADSAEVFAHGRGFDVVAIEEAQFFDPGLPGVVDRLARSRTVIVNGLNQDFAGRPFGPMPEILALADRVIVLSAICSLCGAEATKSQRLIGGQPARASDPLVLVGGFDDETYEARCRAHHVVHPDGSREH